MDWLTSAAALPGKALHVGLALWYRAGLKKTGWIAFSVSGAARLMGFSQPSASRGLRALEKAGLVQVERGPGRRPVVVILDAPGPSEEGESR
jgi:DNA-binding MarR family transcriptional regulator